METDAFVELIGAVVTVDIPCGVDTVPCSVVLCVADVSDVVVDDASDEDLSVIVNSSRVDSNEWPLTEDDSGFRVDSCVTVVLTTV